MLILIACAMISFTLFGIIYFANEYSTPEVFSEHVSRYSFMYGVDANLAYAVIKAESGFDEDEVSRKGARGLMQLMPATEKFIAEELNEERGYDIFDPEINIKFGVWYLSYLTEKFESRELVIAAYNAGEGTVRKWMSAYGTELGCLCHIPYPETKRYLRNVLKFFELYRNKYNY
ncbi:MAG: lytic transglycosylase domain-containing protein [Christensenellales bacterium]